MSEPLFKQLLWWGRAAWVILLWFGPAVFGNHAAVFPTRGDDTMSSMGVFRIVVDPSFRSLMTPLIGVDGYPGYVGADGRLTSPLLLGSATQVGRSDPYNRPLVGTTAVGNPSMGSIGYSDFAITPAIFSGAPAGTREILTQVRSFALNTCPDCCSNRDPRVPFIPLNHRMVYAGVSQGVAQKSVGMVQERVANGASDPDFPARSFFDIFVEINLPPVWGTASGSAFPFYGAVLYNTSPLVITNLDLGGLPPHVVYLHGETMAVPLKFRASHPPYWNADDVFGYVVLAGHGTEMNCQSEGSLFLDKVLGPPSNPSPEMPIEWLFPTDQSPPANVTFDSVANLDLVRFSIQLSTGGTAVIAGRNFRHGQLNNPINPPPLGGSATYNDAATAATMELSTDNGATWFPAQATGPVSARLTHTSDAGPTRFFETEMLSLDLEGSNAAGPFLLRESPQRQSLGKHTIRQEAPSSFRVSSFFDVFLELSLDAGATWASADRAIRVQLTPPATCPAPPKLTILRSASNVTISWAGRGFVLQCSPVLAQSSPATPWSDVAVTSPVTLSIVPGQNRFYRLICE